MGEEEYEETGSSSGWLFIRRIVKGDSGDVGKDWEGVDGEDDDDDGGGFTVIGGETERL